MPDNSLRLRVRRELMALADPGYRDFISKLIPNIHKDSIMGVRTPAMRAYAKAFPEDRLRDYLALAPHATYEESNLHTFLIGKIRDYEEALGYTEAFLPHVDNWATCDGFQVKALQRQPARFIPRLREWLSSEAPYTQRFAIVNLMGRCLDSHFQPEMLGWVCDVKSEHYYVNMAIAWYLSEALLKQYELTLPIIEGRGLSRFVHNKAIQKAIESRQISGERKQALRLLRMK